MFIRIFHIKVASREMRLIGQNEQFFEPQNAA